MNLPERNYQQIVEDLLTHLTGGIVGETYAYSDTLQYEIGENGRRIEKITSVCSFDADGARTDFTPFRDFTFQKATDTEPNLITFRADGNKPEEGATLSVNYYYSDISPQITDRNIGSVARTLTEVFSREAATLYATLKNVYDSAFLETAKGKSLDLLVEVLGIRRFKAGFATGIVRFSRSTKAPADINIPVATIVTDMENTVPYLTTQEKILRAGQTEVMVPVRATVKGTPAEIKTLVLMPKPVLGIEKVENPEATQVGISDETDEELRDRARRVIKGSTTSTIEAIDLALKGIPNLKSVTIIDRPKGVNGKVDIIVAGEGSEDELKEQIVDVLSRVKPAGIYVNVEFTRKVYPRYTFNITPSGELSDDEKNSATTDIAEKIKAYFEQLKPGENVLAKKIVAIILDAKNVYDVTFDLATVKLDGADDLERSLSNGDLYIKTNEKVTFKAENLILNFADEKTTAEEPEEAQKDKIFIDVRLKAALKNDAIGFKQVKKIVESKVRLFFDVLTEGDRFLLENLYLSVNDAPDKYEVDKPSLTVRSIHARDGLIVNLSSTTPLDEVRENEAVEVLSIEIEESE